MRLSVRIAGMALLAIGLILVLPPATTRGSGNVCGIGCVTTHSYDNSRDNVNASETTLKASNLSLTHHYTRSDLTGVVYAQPLYVSQLQIGTTTYNALFVATEANHVYALDGDSSTLATVWDANLNFVNNMDTGDEAVPDAYLPGTPACTNIAPEVGIKGTPVIDVAGSSPMLFAVSKHYNKNTGVITQRLNALSITNASPLPATLDIASTFSSVFPSLPAFSAVNQNQRAGLALTHDAANNPLIYVAWGSHCDSGSYAGYVGLFKFSSGSFSLLAAFTTEGGVAGTLQGSQGGIWMSGSAAAIDDSGESSPSGDVYLSSGNGSFKASGLYGESVLRLGYQGTAGTYLNVKGFYTPNGWQILNSNQNCAATLNLPAPESGTVCTSGDFDLGAGGVILARPAGFNPNNENFVALAAGKEGIFYVNLPSKMAANSTADTVDPCTSGSSGQTVQCLGAIFLPPACCSTQRDYGNRGSAAFWAGNATYQQNVLYVMGSQDTLIRAYQMDNSSSGRTGAFLTTLYGSATPQHLDSGGKIPYPGASPVVSWNSANGLASDAILWIVDATGFQNNTNGNHAPTTVGLYAYTAVPSQTGTFTLKFTDTANGPGAVKFTVPTVVNGHVYVGGQQTGTYCSMAPCLGAIAAWH
jgi:hypothetical protein